MSQQRIAFGAIVAAAVLATACAGTPEGPIQPPVIKADVQKMEIEDQSFTDFEAVATVNVPPAARELKVENATYEIIVNGKKLGTGAAPLDVTIPAEGGKVAVKARSLYAPEDQLGELLAKPDALPVLFKGEIHTVGGPIYQFSQAGLVRAPRTPGVKIEHVEAGAFPDEKKIGLVFFVLVENRNPFDIDVKQLKYNLAVNDTKMIDDGVIDSNEKVPPASVAQLEIPLTLSEKNFPSVQSYIKSGSGLTYALDGDLKIGIGHIPVDLQGPIELGKGSEEE